MRWYVHAPPPFKAAPRALDVAERGREGEAEEIGQADAQQRLAHALAEPMRRVLHVGVEQQ
jgi:hypothetical protein